MKFGKRILPLFLSLVLIVAMALCTTGCNGNSNNETSTAATQNESPAGIRELGEGKNSFNFTVVDKDGNETSYKIATDKEMVGDALLEHNLIAGEEGQYGLYVKTVNGIRADYDKDGVYWAFYVDGAYAMSGVDATEITNGASYSFKVEK